MSLSLLLGLMTLAVAQALSDPGAEAMLAFVHPPEAHADSSTDSSSITGDGEDEDAFPNPLTPTTFISLISYLTLPHLTGISFYHPPLLQPPQPR